MGVTYDTAVIPVTEPDPVRYELKPNELVAKAIENRMEMLELEFQIAQETEAIDFYQEPGSSAGESRLYVQNQRPRSDEERQLRFAVRQ